MEVNLKDKVKNPKYNQAYENLMTIASEVVENFLYERVARAGAVDTRAYLVERFSLEYSTHLKSDIRKTIQKNLLAWDREQKSWRFK
ncbi:MAG: hypothetical protein QGF31_07685 [Nitrospinota bacterium]|jgi:hypothetical protein|nr:hypothetical protein [Nitrospinota bacterium]|tara:strand:+ start:188 stop:448 length:261 start_codon:yes stop_codon:yes gene_type:complete